MNNSTDYFFNNISPKAIQALDRLEFSKTGTKRLCLHENLESELHVMLIRMEKNNKFSFHKHMHSDEFVILMEGDLTYTFEDESIISLYEDGNISLIIPCGVIHSVSTGKKGALFVEVIKGPFKKENIKKL